MLQDLPTLDSKMKISIISWVCIFPSRKVSTKYVVPSSYWNRTTKCILSAMHIWFSSWEGWMTLPGERNTNLASVYACLSKVWQKPWLSLIRLSYPVESIHTGWIAEETICAASFDRLRIGLRGLRLWEQERNDTRTCRPKQSSIHCFLPLLQLLLQISELSSSCSTEIHLESWETVTALSTHSKMISTMIHTVF